MTNFRTPRFLLLTTAALIFGSQASAQNLPNYQTGAPTMVAGAPSFPNISADQIAQDVISEFNPRTGQRELIAAPFDPLEEDPTTAGSLRLRSADGAVAIDGRPLRDGAIVELDFYYNSPSDDPYGGRNYGEVAFVSGELAPVVLRNTRILECSTRVENVFYDHASYYDRGYSVGVYRPYRHYTGHSSFGFGFGSNYFGPGFGSFSSLGAFGNSRSFSNNRSFGLSGTRRTRSNRVNTTRRNFDGDRDRNSDERREARRDNRDSDERREARRENRGSDERREARRDNRDNRNAARDNDGNRADRRDRRSDRRDRRNDRGLTNRDIDERLNRARIYHAGQSNANARRNSEVASARRALIRSQTQTQTQTQAQTQSAPAQPRAQNRTQQRNSRQVQSRRTEDQRSQIKRTETKDNNPKRQTVKNSAPKTKKSSTSKSRKSSTSRSRPKKSSTKRSRPTRSSAPKRSNSRNLKSKLNFFPNEGYGYDGRSVVSSANIDCAREDKLRVFIPNARLDAGRFDGLTLIALDAQGGETPIYLPPNYIEGFRLAATGRVRPQGNQSAPTPTPQYSHPQYAPPQYSTPGPRFGIETAPCPAGTSNQADGTCLQAGNVGYPTR